MAADSEDFQSKNKLRLLRICERLCPREAAPELAIALNVLLCADPLMYFLLGDGTKPRATLVGLCSATDSPISQVQGRIVDRLHAWGEPGPDWALYTCMGGSPNDKSFALTAKRELLLLSAATVDHFELRMSHPPYTLIALSNPAVPEAERRRIAAEFVNCPHHCLSLFCRRLRARCPDAPTVMHSGAKLVQAWAQGSYVGIDISERTHAKMWQSVKSGGRGRTFVSAANRLVCAELRETHMARGGRDPALLDVTSLEEAGRAQGASPETERGAAGAAGGRRNTSGLNPYLAYRNHRFHMSKVALRPGETMTPEAMQSLEANCSSDWAGMTEAEKQPWVRIFRGKLVARSLPPLRDAEGGAVGATPEYRPWCGSGTQQQPIPLSDICNYRGSADGSSGAPRANSEDQWWVQSAPPRASLLPKGSEVQRLMWGCYGTKKTCREVLSPQVALGVDGITSLLRGWTRSLGAEVVGMGQSLCCLRGVSPSSGARKDIVLLLIMQRRPPPPPPPPSSILLQDAV